MQYLVDLYEVVFDVQCVEYVVVVWVYVYVFVVVVVQLKNIFGVVVWCGGDLYGYWCCVGWYCGVGVGEQCVGIELWCCVWFDDQLVWIQQWFDLWLEVVQCVCDCENYEKWYYEQVGIEMLVLECLVIGVGGMGGCDGLIDGG